METNQNVLSTVYISSDIISLLQIKLVEETMLPYPIEQLGSTWIWSWLSLCPGIHVVIVLNNMVMIMNARTVYGVFIL